MTSSGVVQLEAVSFQERDNFSGSEAREFRHRQGGVSLPNVQALLCR